MPYPQDKAEIQKKIEEVKKYMLRTEAEIKSLKAVVDSTASGSGAVSGSDTMSYTSSIFSNMLKMCDIFIQVGLAKRIGNETITIDSEAKLFFFNSNCNKDSSVQNMVDAFNKFKESFIKEKNIKNIVPDLYTSDMVASTTIGYNSSTTTANNNSSTTIANNQTTLPSTTAANSSVVYLSQVGYLMPFFQALVNDTVSVYKNDLSSCSFTDSEFNLQRAVESGSCSLRLYPNATGSVDCASGLMATCNFQQLGEVRNNSRSLQFYCTETGYLGRSVDQIVSFSIIEMDMCQSFRFNFSNSPNFNTSSLKLNLTQLDIDTRNNQLACNSTCVSYAASKNIRSPHQFFTDCYELCRLYFEKDREIIIKTAINDFITAHCPSGQCILMDQDIFNSMLSSFVESFSIIMRNNGLEIVVKSFPEEMTAFVSSISEFRNYVASKASSSVRLKRELVPDSDVRLESIKDVASNQLVRVIKRVPTKNKQVVAVTSVDLNQCGVKGLDVTRHISFLSNEGKDSFQGEVAVYKREADSSSTEDVSSASALSVSNLILIGAATVAAYICNYAFGKKVELYKNRK